MISLPLFSLLTDVTALIQHGPTDVPIVGLTLDSRGAAINLSKPLCSKEPQLFCAKNYPLS